MAKQSKWDTNVKPNLELIEAWARRGAIEADIAKNLNVARSTFENYKRDYPELREALRNGKEPADLQVEAALFKKAVGYEYKEVRNEVTDGGWKEVVTTKQVAPDTTAQIFWLKNRRPDLWRDKQDVELSGEVNNPFEGLTTEELKALAKEAND
ncbi:transposase [Erysipelotrichaceae bacterium MTC7]|nr:transposase [Erysipelotrichaceae bacterium MTC7]